MAMAAATGGNFPPREGINIFDASTVNESVSKWRFPSLAKEGWLRDQEDFAKATLARADGVVGSIHRLSVV